MCWSGVGATCAGVACIDVECLIMLDEKTPWCGVLLMRDPSDVSYANLKIKSSFLCRISSGVV